MQSVMKARTTLQLNEANFEWTVVKWSRNSYLQTELFSQEFQLVETGKTFFGKILLPGGSSQKIFVLNLETCKELQKAVVKAYVSKATNEKVDLSYNRRLDNVKLNEKNFISLEFNLNEQHIENDTLTIFCSINYVLEYCGVKNITRIYNGIEKDYAKMMTPNITPQNFKAFLECIYGCKSVADLNKIVSEILILADKFGVKKLQESCESYLSDMLSEQNVAKTLLFAEIYRCTALKEQALNFARAHIEVVKESDEFEGLCKLKELMRLLL